MADKPVKSSRVLQQMFKDDNGQPIIGENDYDLMKINAGRYARTDAGLEDDILQQMFNRDDIQAFLNNPDVDPDKRDSVFTMMPGEFGKTKVFNAAGVLQAMGVEVPKKGDRETPEQKLVRLYDDPKTKNKMYNSVRRDKDYGDLGASNLAQLVETARVAKKENPDVSWPAKVAGSLFAPRMLEAAMDGRTPGAKDVALDAVEDILMAIPVGTAAAGGLKIATRLNKLKKLEESARAAAKAHETAGTAAKILGGTAGASVVPFAMEGIDAAAYNPDENLDRSTFQLPDAITGAATNVSAPFMLSRLTGRLGRWLYGGNPLAKLDDAKKASLGGQMIGSFITNRYGTNRNANMTLGALGNLTQFIDPGLDLSEKLEDWRNENARNARDEARSDVAGKILKGSIMPAAEVSPSDQDLSEDAFWLTKITEKPSIVRGDGLGASAAFKNWWNTRGLRLLQDSSIFPGIKE